VQKKMAFSKILLAVAFVGNTTAQKGIESIFGSIASSLAKATDPNTPLSSLSGLMGGAGSEAPKTKLTDEEWKNPGTGPYPAKWITHESLPNKTIYAPIDPPKIKLPLVVWGEGGCFQTGIFYAPFLLEIASHGYFILANGPPNGRSPTTIGDLQKLMGLPRSTYTDLLDSITWAESGKAAKYGDIDLTKIAAAGQSCGGGEATSATAAKTDKIKLTMLVNSGSPSPSMEKIQGTFQGPVGIFNGGPHDIAYENVSWLQEH